MSLIFSCANSLAGVLLIGLRGPSSSGDGAYGKPNTINNCCSKAIGSLRENVGNTKIN